VSGAGWMTRREQGPAEEGGSGAYCDLIIDPQGRIREIVEYDAEGRETMRVYGMPVEDES
jgi:hypothetical protein